MEEEMQKWKRKDLPAIRRSMANPGQEVVPCELRTVPSPDVNFNRYLPVSLQMSWTN